MNKFVLGLIVLISLSFKEDTQSTVYICNSRSSKAYHLDKNCFALKNCSHNVYAVSREDAIHKYGRRLCGHED